MRSLLLLAACLFSSTVFSQIRFKPVIEGGAGFDKDNFYTLNAGLLTEVKLDIDKGIETGILYHNFDFYRPVDQDFYDAFIQGTEHESAWDTTSHMNVSFHFTSIPVGLNYYVSPKFYVGYRMAFNFFSKSKFTGIDARNTIDPIDGLETFSAEFDRSLFKKFYLNHLISFNYIILRRFDGGLGFMFTPKGEFFKETPNDQYASFNNEVSKYFAMTVNFKIYLFQIKSRSL